MPEVNFNAEDYIDLIDWFNCTVTEPPLVRHLSDQELWDIVKQVPNFDNFPCHTQAVERGVKIITEASTKVCGEESRDGFIRAKFDARKDLPKFESKCQYYASRPE